MTTITAFTDEAEGWQMALYAFLPEKERRSGSKRTVDSYSRMLQEFFGRLGKPPDLVTAQDVFAYAHGIGRSGREPSAITIGARMSCVSAFFRFLIRMEIVNSNPCDKLERPRTAPSPPRGLSAEEIKRLLDVIPDSPSGLRDRAIVTTLILTGRRRSEVINLRAGDLQIDGDKVFYTYRGKGGKRGRRELPRPAYAAITGALVAFGKEFTMPPDASLWPSSANSPRGITSGTFYTNLRKYLKVAGLPLSGIHIFRHSAAKLRRDAGESIEQVSSFLDHSSLAVTSTYLRRLEGEHDAGWERVADAIGL